MTINIHPGGRSAIIADFCVSHPLTKKEITKEYRRALRASAVVRWAKSKGLRVRRQFESRFGNEASRFEIIVDLPADLDAILLKLTFG